MAVHLHQGLFLQPRSAPHHLGSLWIGLEDGRSMEIQSRYRAKQQKPLKKHLPSKAKPAVLFPEEPSSNAFGPVSLATGIELLFLIQKQFRKGIMAHDT